jgi:HEAT repeat protein
MRTKFPFKIVLLLAAFAQLAAAQEVVHHPDSSQSLSQRWAWAVEQSRQPRFKKGCWIGYSIRRLMEENSTIGSVHIERGRVYSEPGKSLSELIYGIKLPLELSASRAKSQQKVVKEVGLFFLFDPRDGALAEIKQSTFSLGVDFDDFSLLWLGRANDEQSLNLLEQLYRQTASSKRKEEVIATVGLHEQSAQRRNFLAAILTGDEATQVRKQAAFWLGQADDPEALRLLRQTAKSDRSTEVRKQAVFAMSQMHLPEAEDALFELARAQTDRAVRKDAIFWLAQTAAKQAAPILKNTAYKDADTAIQKQAVFALTQLADNQGVPILIDIAQNHHNSVVRKEAIFWLGQSDDARATEALLKIVRGQK